LAHNPECIIADEPTGNLDRSQSTMIAQTLIDLHQAGQTVLFITHDEHLVSFIRKQLSTAKLHQW
jgi:putative ABC transport system ATP-binding protein